MQWKGPYWVIEKVGRNDYRVEIGDNKKLFHINMLKNYHTRDVDHDMAFASIVLEHSESEPGEDSPISNNEETISDVVLNPRLSPDQTRKIQNLMNEFPAFQVHQGIPVFLVIQLKSLRKSQQKASRIQFHCPNWD